MLSIRDAQWLERLAADNELVPRKISAFLEEHFFNSTSGRALILQPARNEGYFYLNTRSYDSADLVAAEIKKLLDLFILLSRLRADGFLYLLGSRSHHEAMIFVGDLFEQPRPSSAHLVLNSAGDYCFRPDAIQNANDDVIYKGYLLKDEAYELVLSSIDGLAYVTEEARALIAPASVPPAEVVPEPREQRASPWLLAAPALMLALAIACVYWWRPSSTAQQQLPGAHRQANPQTAPTVSRRAESAPVAPAAPTVVSPVPARGTVSRFSPGPLFGVDLSKWNAHPALILRQRNVGFAFARASYGLHVDPAFATYWSIMERERIPRGAYHFFRVDADPIRQADLLARLAGEAGPRDLCPAIDFEEGSLPSRTAAPTVRQVQEALLSHLKKLEQLRGCTPFIYTNRDVGNRYLDDRRFSRYPLWIADWSGVREPRLPNAWKLAGYRIWQRSSTYKVADAPGDDMDLDVFPGSTEDLSKLFHRSAGNGLASDEPVASGGQVSSIAGERSGPAPTQR